MNGYELKTQAIRKNARHTGFFFMTGLMTMLMIILLTMISILPLNAYADDKEADKKKPVKAADVTVVVTAAKQPQAIGSVTQKIDVVAQDEIKTLVSQNRNISEAIMYKPGASVSTLSRNDANWGTYGGIGPKYCTYMLQGLPIDAFMDPMSLDIQAIGQIEVLRGPASVLYPTYLSQDFAGSQSPLAGTVNLILKERIEKQSTQLSLAYGTYNTVNAQFYHENNIRNIHFFAGGSYEMSDYANYGTENSWLNMKDKPEYRKTKLYSGITLSLDKEKNHKFTLFVNKTFHKGDAGRTYRGFNHDYLTVNGSYFIELADKLTFEAGLGLRTYDRQWQESNFDVVDHLVSNNGVYQNIVPAHLTLSMGHGANHLLIVGLDYQAADYHTWSDPLLGYELFGNKSTAWQMGLFAQEELRFENLILRGGLRFARIKDRIDFINGGAPGLQDSAWNKLLWSAGGRYTLTPTLAIYANAGSSFITPGLKSVGGTIFLNDLGVPGKHGQLPNPNLKPESGLAFDGGMDITAFRNINVSLRGFSITVDDAIVENVVSQNPSQTQSINAGKSSSLGLEIEISQRLNSSLQWFANYTHIKTKIKNELDADQNNSEVPFSPRHILNAGITINTSFGMQISSYLNYNGGYFDSSAKSGRKKFTPGALLNVYVSQRIAKSASYQLDCYAAMVNLTANRFEMPWQFRNLGFSILTGLKASF